MRTPGWRAGSARCSQARKIAASGIAYSAACGAIRFGCGKNAAYVFSETTDSAASRTSATCSDELSERRRHARAASTPVAITAPAGIHP